MLQFLGDNKPNLSVAADIKVVSNDKIIIAHNEMINTPKNILTNKNVVLTSFNEHWQGLRIVGIADYYTNGEYYDLCKKYFSKETPSGITNPKGAIVITVEKCEEIK